MGDSNVEIGEAGNEDTYNNSKLNQWVASSFIYLYELGERSAFYTMKASMPMYLYLYLGYSRKSTVVIYHAFESFASFSCLLGAIVADGHIGKFRTIFFSSMLYFSGLSCLIISVIPETSQRGLTFLGLALSGLACGGVRPTVAAFGGDQFPESSYPKKLLIFFVIYVVISHLGMFLGQILAPILRDNSSCYKTECYMMPFVIALVFLIGAIVCFMLGQNKFKIVIVKSHVVLEVMKAIMLGIIRKILANRDQIPQQPHWLDHAIPECGVQLVEDTKILVRLAWLTLPAPLFFIIYCQTGSNWVFQAAAMNRTVGNMELSPESVLLSYPLLAILLVPVYYFALRPLLNLLMMKSIPQKITIGGFLATISVTFAAVVESKLEETQLQPLQKGLCQFRIYNGIPYCKFNLTTDIPGTPKIKLKAMGYFQDLELNVESRNVFYFNVTSNEQRCKPLYNQKFELKGHAAISYFFYYHNYTFKIRSFSDVTKKPVSGALLRVLIGDPTNLIPLGVYSNENNEWNVHYEGTDFHIDPIRVPSTTIEVYHSNRILKAKFSTGEVLTLLAAEKHVDSARHRIHLASPHSLPVYWLIPQLICLAMSDVIISINVLHFAYATAPGSMKTLFIAFWYLTMLVGNLLLLIITRLHIFAWKKYEYIFYAALMFIGTSVFSVFVFLFEKQNKNESETDN